MTDEGEFLKALAASPGDGLAIQAFADWLEERGDARAPWVRDPLVRPWMGPTFADPAPAILEGLRRRGRVLEARRAAARIGEALVPGLVELLKDGRSAVRVQALRCLRKLGPAAVEARPALVEALSDPSESVRERAAEVLGALGAKGAAFEDLVAALGSPRAADRLAAIAGLRTLGGERIAEPLCRLLGDPVVAVRERAAEVASWYAGTTSARAVGSLRAALNGRPSMFRRNVLACLARIGRGAGEATADVLALIDRPDGELARGAIEAYGAIAPEDDAAIDRLLALVEAGTHAEAAIRGLIHFAVLPERASPVLLHFLRTTTARGYPLLWVLSRLERLTPGAVAFLRDALRDTQGQDRYAVPGVALGLGRQALPLLDDLTEQAANGLGGAAVAISMMGEPGLVRLAGLLSSDDEAVRVDAARALQYEGRAALVALPELRAALRRAWYAHDKVEVVRAVRDIGPAAIEALPELLAVARESNEAAAKAALKAVARFGPAAASAAATLGGMLAWDDFRHRRAAIAEALGKVSMLAE